MLRIGCSQIWGGIEAVDSDVQTGSIAGSVYSSACGGGKGGDVYYLSVCGVDKLTRIAIADVVGHGEAVSTMGQWLCDALTARMNSGDGNGVLVDLNRIVLERGFTALTTAAVVAFYRANYHLYVSYAGHPPVLLHRRDAHTWDAVQLPASPGPANLPLGVASETAYVQFETPVQAGDRLFLYTDGLIEATDRRKEPFGTQRLIRTLQHDGDGSLADVKHAVLEAARRHAGGDLTHDDVTLLAIEIT